MGLARSSQCRISAVSCGDGDGVLKGSLVGVSHVKARARGLIRVGWGWGLDIREEKSEDDKQHYHAAEEDPAAPVIPSAVAGVDAVGVVASVANMLA